MFSASGNIVARSSCKGPCTSNPLILPQIQQESNNVSRLITKHWEFSLLYGVTSLLEKPMKTRGLTPSDHSRGQQSERQPSCEIGKPLTILFRERTDILKASQILAFSILSRGSSSDRPLPSQSGQLGVTARYNRRTTFQGTKALSIGPWWSRSATPYLY
jgi:hypothetical protein